MVVVWVLFGVVVVVVDISVDDFLIVKWRSGFVGGRGRW